MSSEECPDPVSPSDGYTLLAKLDGVNSAGSRALYRCNTGYTLQGDRSRYDALYDIIYLESVHTQCVWC